MVNQQNSSTAQIEIDRLTEENKQLRALLDHQTDLVESRYKIFTHEIAGAIQVLILSLDSIEHNPNSDLKSNFERMRWSSKNMVKIQSDLREERKKKSTEIL